MAAQEYVLPSRISLSRCKGEDRSEFVYGYETSEESLSAINNSESAIAQRGNVCAGIFKRRCSSIDGEADGE
jgi:hypothetical protein